MPTYEFSGKAANITYGGVKIGKGAGAILLEKKTLPLPVESRVSFELADGLPYIPPMRLLVNGEALICPHCGGDKWRCKSSRQSKDGHEFSMDYECHDCAFKGEFGG